MARPASERYFIIWSVRRDRLLCARIDGDAYAEYGETVTALDRALLPLIAEYAKPLSGIRGIAVARSDLGGFASSRLALVTLNMIAWQQSVPVVSIDPEWRDRPESIVAHVRALFRHANGFTGPLLPRYERPADITRGRKKKFFIQ